MVETSSSPFGNSTNLVTQKDVSWRICITYRKLNSVTKKNAHPLPQIEDILDTHAGSVFHDAGPGNGISSSRGASL